MTLDTVFRIASMTKAITSVAAMQVVEQGKLTLDEPVPNIDPALGSPQVLEGFDAAGAPRLRPAKRPITLRHLLTHTAGFSYEVWNANTVRYVKATGMPSTVTGKVAALRLPLVFDPGDKWEYGINIDWVGRLVEAVSGQTLDAYFRDKIFVPLGMKDSGYITSDEQRARQARVHQRQADGSLVPQPLATLSTPEFWSGGGPLYSTGPDYLTFLQMLLHGGSLNGVRLLRRERRKRREHLRRPILQDGRRRDAVTPLTLAFQAGRAHSLWLVMRAPSTRAPSFAQAIAGSTVGVPAKVAKPQSTPAMTFSRPTRFA
jgi:CubicO group peptidase (beta-lactamase class C family)